MQPRELPVTSTDTGIHVAFDEYLSPDYNAGTAFNNFNLSRKKTYRNISERIAWAVKYAGDRSEKFVGDYHAIKCVISGLLDAGSFIAGTEDQDVDPGAITVEQFYSAIDRVLDDRVYAIISDYVEENFVDIQQDADARVRNAELQFKAVHTKAVIKASFAAKLVIPLLLDFCDLRWDLVKEASPRSAENPVNNFIYIAICRILRRFAPDGVDLENKLFKLVESRVVATQYSDKIMWTYLRNVGITPEVMIRSLFRKLIYDILPKLEHDRGVVSYIHATLKNQIGYLFAIKFHIQFRPISTIDVDAEDGSNPFERIEQAYQHDEGLGVIDRENVPSVIRKFQRELDYAPTVEEVAYYMHALRVNKLQKQILGLLFQRELGRSDVLNYASRKQYVRLLLLAKRSLERQDLPIMADYLVGVPAEAEVVQRENIGSKRFLTELVRGPSYRKLHQRFAFVSQRFADSGIIVSFIATMDKNKFYRMPEMGQAIGDEPDELNHSIVALADEAIRFISSLS